MKLKNEIQCKVCLSNIKDLPCPFCGWEPPLLTVIRRILQRAKRLQMERTMNSCLEV